LDKNATTIADGITVYGNFTRTPLDPKMLIKTNDGKFVVDDFDEEIAVAIDTSKGLVIVTGCSHTGIVNIVNAIQERSHKKVYAVIGGFHLLDATDKQIQDCIDRFKGLGIQHLGLSHCTGMKAKNMFLQQLPDSSFVNSTGSVFEMK
jgi:7,8-dihydropterin-6-yl-methyl-4-(beta-D-ribofuranosyl)aminobenzene 5'-phosphate synthase